MDLLTRVAAIERRLDQLENRDVNFEYSRDKSNTNNILGELKRLRDIVGIPSVVEPNVVNWDQFDK